MRSDRGYSLETVGLAFVTGGLAGAAVALLLAPQPGREARGQMRGYARRAEGRVHELADTASQIMDQGREFIKDTQAVVAEALEAGRTAIQRERERKSGDKKL